MKKYNYFTLMCNKFKQKNNKKRAGEINSQARSCLSNRNTEAAANLS